MPRPVMERVDSSSIEAIGYDPATSELHVRFHSGGTYVYVDVPATTFDAFITAPSIGRYFVLFVRPYYEYRQE